MKIHYICEVCEQEFETVELDGTGRDLSIKGFCIDCSMEMGFNDVSLTNSRLFYN